MQPTIIVAGITRSGLTATMQMLNAGGYPCLGTYPAFEHIQFPDINFASEKGKAIKLVDTNNNFPPTGDYYVLRLRRDADQQAKSYVKFARLACGIPATKQHIPGFKKSAKEDYQKIDNWGKRQLGFKIINFEDIIKRPLQTAKEIQQFIDYPLDVQKMADIIVKRSTNCYDGLLEMTMI